eukprot:scaffold4633_cov114-Isochrysis_galbana.AAC.9
MPEARLTGRVGLNDVARMRVTCRAMIVSESALSEGTSPVWPWTGAGARRLASCVPGASCSRAWVLSIGGSHKNKHTSQARGTWRRGKEGTRRRGKEPTPRVPREVDYCAGAFPHPFRGREGRPSLCTSVTVIG